MSSSSIPEAEGAVVISCDQLPPQKIISRIIEKETQPSATYCSNIKGYLWNLDTKYYTADVYLYALEQQETLEPKLCETIKAIVFYVDNPETSNFDDVKNWMPYLKDIEAEVQILICNLCWEESKGRQSLLNWCVQNQFELVELNSSDDEQDHFCSRDAIVGFYRVRRSLESHLWANLKMKDDKAKLTRHPESGDLVDSKEISKPEEKDCSGGGDASAACNLDDSTVKKESTKTPTKVKVENVELELEEQWLSQVLGGEDPGDESFEAMFDKFASMKERAAGLNEEQRKKYAEKVAVAFWRAIGGDEVEIDGLDDD